MKPDEQEIILLGVPEIPIYLVPIGSQWLLIEAGVSSLSNLVLKQLKAYVGDLDTIRHWVVTHAHYDHVGMLPYLLPYLKNVQVHGVESVSDALSSQTAIKVIDSLNKKVPTQSWDGHASTYLIPKITYDKINIHPLYDNHYLDLGYGKRLFVISTPGHSRCSTSFLLEPAGVLFVSDTLGEMISKDTWLPLAFDDLNQYENSIKYLRGIDAKFLALGHHGMIRDDKATGRQAALNAYYAFRERCTHGVVSGQCFEQVAKSLFHEYGDKSSTFVPQRLFISSMQRMLTLFEQCESKGE